jgi:hypothetical protein
VTNYHPITQVDFFRFFALKQAVFLNVGKSKTTIEEFFCGVWMKDDKVKKQTLDLGNTYMEVCVAKSSGFEPTAIILHGSIERSINLLERPYALLIGKQNRENDSIISIPPTIGLILYFFALNVLSESLKQIFLVSEQTTRSEFRRTTFSEEISGACFD